MAVNQKPASSPSHCINKAAKDNWIGSTPKGTTNTQEAINAAHNKKPVKK